MSAKLNPVVQVVAGLVVVLGGITAAGYAVSRGETFLAFLAVAAMLGALVPLYPPEDPPDGMIR